MYAMDPDKTPPVDAQAPDERGVAIPPRRKPKKEEPRLNLREWLFMATLLTFGLFGALFLMGLAWHGSEYVLVWVDRTFWPVELSIPVCRPEQ